jgi:hypothetical protein
MNGHEVARGNIKTCGNCQYTRDLRERSRGGHGKLGKSYTSITTSKRNLYTTYVKNAIRRELSWELTPEQFIDITEKSCTYCGQEPAQRFNKGKLLYNGIDRINNSLGYTQENTTACCGKCNRMKYTLNLSDFLEHLLKIVDYLHLVKK